MECGSGGPGGGPNPQKGKEMTLAENNMDLGRAEIKAQRQKEDQAAPYNQNAEILLVTSKYLDVKRHAKVWGVIPDLSNYPLDQQELVTAQIVHTLCMMLKESGND